MFRLFAIVFMSVFVAGAAAACTLRMPADAQRMAVPQARIDTALLDAAVRAEVNYARCRAGLPALDDAGRRMARVAEGHSDWMSRAQRLQHQSNVSGRRDLSERVKAGGVRRVRTGAENIGYVSLYQIDGAPFRIVDAGSCRFASHGGQALGVHSYASIARQIVGEWMRSAGHRRNILNPNVRSVGTGAAYDPRAPYCGRVWFTQIFVG